MAVRDRGPALAVGDVVDGAGDRGDDTEGLSPPTRASSAGSPPSPTDSTPRTSASKPTSVATSPAFPRRTVTSTSSSSRRAVSVRYAVAPAPTGSSTTGMPRSFAALPASSIASTQCSESVPMLSTSAPARPTISATSSCACAITGSAPSARIAFAVSFMTT